MPLSRTQYLKKIKRCLQYSLPDDLCILSNWNNKSANYLYTPCSLKYILKQDLPDMYLRRVQDDHTSKIRIFGPTFFFQTTQTMQKQLTLITLIYMCTKLSTLNVLMLTFAWFSEAALK